MNIENFSENVGKPRYDESGRQILHRFNARHQLFALWAISHLPVDWSEEGPLPLSLLELGCGGGRNIANLLPFVKNISAIDHSQMSVSYSEEYNRSAISAKRVSIEERNVSSLPFNNESFHLATAFETIYYWSELDKAFKEIFRCLKPGGSFMIANETDKPDDWADQNIENLVIHHRNTLESLLKAAGFAGAKSYIRQKEGWVVVIGQKPD